MKICYLLLLLFICAVPVKAQEIETAAEEPVQTERPFSEELTDQLRTSMQKRYGQMNAETLQMRKTELERQLRSRSLSFTTRQRLTIEGQVITDNLNRPVVQ